MPDKNILKMVASNFFQICYQISLVFGTVYMMVSDLKIHSRFCLFVLFVCICVCLDFVCVGFLLSVAESH